MPEGYRISPLFAISRGYRELIGNTILVSFVEEDLGFTFAQAVLDRYGAGEIVASDDDGIAGWSGGGRFPQPRRRSPLWKRGVETTGHTSRVIVELASSTTLKEVPHC